MSKIILNPEKGAPIRNVQIQGQILFKDTPFEIDTMIKVENDKSADDLLRLYGFLEVLKDKQEVKAYMSSKKARAFKCEQCPSAFSEKVALEDHKKKHLSDGKMDNELGIEVIADIPKEEVVSNEELNKRREEAEKKHLESGGITGGWEDDAPPRRAVM